MVSKKLKGDISQYALIRIAEIIIGLSMIVVLYIYANGLIYGTCWQNTIQDLKEIQSEASLLTQDHSSKKLFMEFGTCTDVVILTNRDSFDKMLVSLAGINPTVESKFKCFPQEFRTILAAIKKTDKSPSFLDVGTAVLASDRKTVEDWARAFIGLDQATECISLKCDNCTFRTGGLTLPIIWSNKTYLLLETNISMAKGSMAVSAYIMLIGKLIVEIVLLSMFTSQVIIPGINAAEVIESVSLANSLATSINSLSIQDEGTIKFTFSKEFLIITGIESKNFIAVEKEDKKVFLEAKLKNLIHKKTKTLIIKKDFSSNLIEVIPE